MQQVQCVNTIAFKPNNKNGDDTTSTNIDRIRHNENTQQSNSTTLRNNLPQETYCYIVDTDSIQYAIDTGDNFIIVNDAKLIIDLIPTTDKIKGIGSNCVRIVGTGKLRLPLKSDDGEINIVSKLDAVYVPSSSYNLIPSQILIKKCDYKAIRSITSCMMTLPTS